MRWMEVLRGRGGWRVRGGSNLEKVVEINGGQAGTLCRYSSHEGFKDLS